VTTTVQLPACEVPVIGQYDVLVCGGGPAGTAAAIAAGRLGAKTILIERYNHLGGLASGGQVVLLPKFVDNGRPIIGGIGKETRQRLIDSGLGAWRRGDDTSYYDPEGLKGLSIEMLQEAGVQILLHSWCSDAVMEDGTLAGAVTVSKAGKQAFLAKMVVDTTGDLDVAASAGVECEKSDFGIGVPFRIGGVDIARWQQARREDTNTTRDIHHKAWHAGGWDGFLGLDPIPTPKSGQDVVWCNNLIRVADGLDPAVLTALEIEGRQMADLAMDILRAEMREGLDHRRGRADRCPHNPAPWRRLRADRRGRRAV